MGRRSVSTGIRLMYPRSARQRRRPAGEWCVSRKAVRGQELDEADQVFNQESHRIRARVEHPFGGQAPVGVPPDPVSRVSPDRGPGLHTVRAGPFLQGSQGAGPPVVSV